MFRPLLCSYLVSLVTFENLPGEATLVPAVISATGDTAISPSWTTRRVWALGFRDLCFRVWPKTGKRPQWIRARSAKALHNEGLRFSGVPTDLES